MLRLLQFLFFGHIHRWIEDDRHSLTVEGSAAKGVRIICTCETCGKPRKFDLI